ncbi:hypothetical protein GW758_00840 [Candidatus Falkowbacteria bacterium]|nr:hypothetical protein [Candidatus Falkowbacteria bacterium]
MKSEITRPMSLGKVIEIPSCDGSEKICGDRTTFVSGIDGDFSKLTSLGINTGPTKIEIYEIVKDGTFYSAFSGLDRNWNRKWLSQHQVISFCKNFSTFLRLGGNCTFILIKKDEQLPVNELNPLENLAPVQIYVRGGSRQIALRELDCDIIWKGKDKNRLIIPCFQPCLR